MSSSVKAYTVRTEEGEGRELSSEEAVAVSKLLTKSLKHNTPVVIYRDYASSNLSTNNRGATPTSRTASTSEVHRSGGGGGGGGGGGVVDNMTSAPDSSQRISSSKGMAHNIHKKRDPTTSMDERRDPPAGVWLAAGGGGDSPKSKSRKLIMEAAFLEQDDDREDYDDCAFNRTATEEDSAADDELLRTKRKSPRNRTLPPKFRHPHHSLPMTTSPASPSLVSQLSMASPTTPQTSPPFPSNNTGSNRPTYNNVPTSVDKLPSVLHPPTSPTNGSVTVNTERGGKKVMSQAEMSEFIRSSIVKARQQAASQPMHGKPLPKTALVEFLPPSVRTSFRAALKQQTAAPMAGAGGGLNKPQGPFPWSPILAQAACSSAASQNHHPYHDELDVRSIAEWTEPSQLTEPSTLLAMSEHFRQSGHGQRGVMSGGFIVVDRNELYEEVVSRAAAAAPAPISPPENPTVTKNNDTSNTVASSSAKKGKNEIIVDAACTNPADNSNINNSNKDPDQSSSSKGGNDPPDGAVPTSVEIECPPAVVLVDNKNNDNRERGGGGSCPKEEASGDDSQSIEINLSKATVDDGEGPLSLPTISGSEGGKQSPHCTSSNDVSHEEASRSGKKVSNKEARESSSSFRKSPRNEAQEKDKASSVVVTKETEGEEEDCLDAIESLRSRVSSPKSVTVGSPKSTFEEGESSAGGGEVSSPKSEVKSDGVGMYVEDDDDTLPTRELPPTIDIMSDEEIDQIVLISMDKAQKTAKREVQEIFQDSKRRKNKLVVKTAEGNKIMSQREVSDLIKETMLRARESAQEEIANLVRESLALARESAKEEIREIVEDSMRRARESTQREMQEFVKESFQKARLSDASAVSYASSQGFGSAADLAFSVQSRQPSSGSHNVTPKAPGQNNSSTFFCEHLKALSEEDQNVHEAPDNSGEESGLSLKTPDKDNSAGAVKGIDAADKSHTTVHASIDPPEFEAVQESYCTKSQSEGDEPQSKPNEVVTIDSKGVEFQLLEPDDDSQGALELEDRMDSSSLMAINTVMSPDVFEGIDDPELQDSNMTDDKILRSRKKDILSQQPMRQIQVFSHEEEEKDGIEIDRLPPTPPGQFVQKSSNDGGNQTDQLTNDNAVPIVPTGSKDSFNSRESSIRESDQSSISKISDSLREFDEKKQKRIEDAAFATSAESDRVSRKKERRRARSVARIDMDIYGDNSVDDNASEKEKTKRSSRTKRHSKRKEQLAPLSPSQFAEKLKKSDKGSRRSRSSPTNKPGRSKSRRKSPSKHHTMSYGSTSSKSHACAAETVVTKEFLSQLSLDSYAARELKDMKAKEMKEMKEMKTPKVHNLTRQPDEMDAGKSKRSHIRAMSMDSVAVPENRFCMDFLQFLVSGDDGVVESAAARAAFVGGGGASGNANKSAGLSALSPAAMFNKGSTWIDSLAEDMSSVLEAGNDSTEFDTEGEMTTFEQESSYSRTDGEDEEDFEDFTYSHDDNSYNAGWWSGRGGRQQLHQKKI